MKVSAVAVAAFFLTAAMAAQDLSPDTQAAAQDPPSRVARLSWTQGAVSFQPATVDEWAPAILNYPLTTGDHLYTDAAARAEMQIGPNAIRLDAHSNFGFLDLDDATVQMQFTEGAMEIRVRDMADRDLYEIDTPEGAISLLANGDYRVDSDPDRNTTMLTVFAGDAEVAANGGTFAVHAGETASFAPGASPDTRSLNPADDFDRWTADRNLAEDRLAPPEYISPAMDGAQDLSAYGSCARRRSTAGCGLRRWKRVGLHIARGIGGGWNRGAGPGSTTRPGASRRFTTDGGLRWVEAGCGCLDRWCGVRYMRLHWWLSWAAERDGWRGFRSVREKCSGRRMRRPPHICGD